MFSLGNLRKFIVSKITRYTVHVQFMYDLAWPYLHIVAVKTNKSMKTSYNCLLDDGPDAAPLGGGHDS